MSVSLGACTRIHWSSFGVKPSLPPARSRRDDAVEPLDLPEPLERVGRGAALLDARVDGHAGAQRRMLDRLEQRHRDRDLGCCSGESGGTRAARRAGRPGTSVASSMRAIRIAAASTVWVELAAGERDEDPRLRGRAVPPAAVATRAATSTSTRRLAPLAQRAVGDDADVDAGQLAHHAGEQRAAEDLAAPPLVGRADEDVRRAALVGDAADGRDEVVALLLEEVDAEDAREPAQGGELRRSSSVGRRPGRPHPERVDLARRAAAPNARRGA